MGWPPDEFVQGSEICDEADTLAVSLGYKECRVHHVVGSLTGAMTLQSMSSTIVFLDFGS